MRALPGMDWTSQFLTKKPNIARLNLLISQYRNTSQRRKPEPFISIHGSDYSVATGAISVSRSNMVFTLKPAQTSLGNPLGNPLGDPG